MGRVIASLPNHSFYAVLTLSGVATLRQLSQGESLWQSVAFSMFLPDGSGMFIKPQKLALFAKGSHFGGAGNAVRR